MDWTKASLENNPEGGLEMEKDIIALFLQHFPGPAFIRDTEGQFLYVNPAWERALQKPIQEVQGKKLEDLWPPEIAQRFRTNDEFVLQNQQALFTTEEVPERDRVRYRHIVRFPLPLSEGDVAVGGIAWDAEPYRRLEEKVEQQIRHLEALRAIDLAITSSLDLKVMSAIFLDHVASQLGVSSTCLLLFDPQSLTLKLVAHRGFKTPEEAYSLELPISQGITGRIFQEQRTFLIARLTSRERELFHPIYQKMIEGEGFRFYAGTPLVAKGEVKGVLEVYDRTEKQVNRDWIVFFETLASQGAIGVDNTQMYQLLKKAHQDLFLAYEITLEAWGRLLEARDLETKGHTQRVTELTVRLAREIGIKSEEIPHLRRGALLHDIGKIGIPDAILLKPGELTEEERKIMQKHPEIAGDILSNIPFLRPAMEIPLYHHERWDGTGYPYGFRGEQIPLSARIFAVVDVWDALTSERPYRKALSPREAQDYLHSQSGKQFDPQVVDAFLQVINHFGSPQ